MHLLSAIVVAVAGSSGFAYAAGESLGTLLAQMPSCAIQCMGVALPNSHCQATNLTCVCNDASFQTNVTSCVMKHCTVVESLTAMNVSQTTCGHPVRDRSAEYVAFNDVFAIITAIFLIQRFAYKIFDRVSFTADDWSCLSTVVIGTISTVINALYLTKNGLGRDIWTLSYSQITEFGRLFYIQEIVYFSEVGLTKLTLLLFYLRIFSSSTAARYLLIATIVVNCMSGFAFTLVAVFQCQPIAHFWQRWDGVHRGSCLNINAISWSNAAISIALDLWMIAIPLYQIRTLTLPWKKRVGVIFMFSVGTFVTIVSMLRLKTLFTFNNETQNPTWDFTDVGILSNIEMCVSIICACLPSLRLLIARLYPKFWEGTRHDSPQLEFK